MYAIVRRGEARWSLRCSPHFRSTAVNWCSLRQQAQCLRCAVKPLEMQRDSKAHVCNRCARPASNCCSRCKAVYYCSRVCQVRSLCLQLLVTCACHRPAERALQSASYRSCCSGFNDCCQIHSYVLIFRQKIGSSATRCNVERRPRLWKWWLPLLCRLHNATCLTLPRRSRCFNQAPQTRGFLLCSKGL